jgi:hypothetical protein
MTEDQLIQRIMQRREREQELRLIEHRRTTDGPAPDHARGERPLPRGIPGGRADQGRLPAAASGSHRCGVHGVGGSPRQRRHSQGLRRDVQQLVLVMLLTMLAIIGCAKTTMSVVYDNGAGRLGPRRAPPASGSFRLRYAEIRNGRRAGRSVRPVLGGLTGLALGSRTNKPAAGAGRLIVVVEHKRHRIDPARAPGAW